MNFKWTKEHTKGFLVALITPMLVAPLVLFIISNLQDYYFEQLWAKFTYNTSYRVKILTLSIIANLIWFYVFLNKENWNFARGVILGSVIYAPYIIYIKFF